MKPNGNGRPIVKPSNRNIVWLVPILVTLRSLQSVTNVQTTELFVEQWLNIRGKLFLFLTLTLAKFFWRCYSINYFGLYLFDNGHLDELKARFRSQNWSIFFNKFYQTYAQNHDITYHVDWYWVVRFLICFKGKKSKILGCDHYPADCQLLSACCGKLYVCRFCHNDREDHTMKRYVTTKPTAQILEKVRN